MPTPPPRDEFEIVVICALPLEADAVEALFNHTWEGVGKSQGDTNTYRTGMIGGHNVVLVFLPGAGKSSAASVASSCRSSFQRIRLALVVGVCGGVPNPKSRKEILLGDVIISDGLVEYDYGRQLPDKFKRKGSTYDNLGRQNLEIRSHLNKLKGKAGRKRLEKNTCVYLKYLVQESDIKAEYPGAENDKLFKPTYRHKHHDSSCTVCTKCKGKSDEVCEVALNSECDTLKCNDNQLVTRSRLVELKTKAAAAVNKSTAKTEPGDIPMPGIHFGLFASGDRVMKSGEDREEIATMENVLAFEMEGAGVWDNFPCVVIKAVCDYADSHKNKRWQEYAAAVAAACMKAFLQEWTVVDKPTSQEQSGGIMKLNGGKLNNAKHSPSASVAFNSDPLCCEPQCLPETQAELLQQIMAWSKDPGGACIFLLGGIAGTGKSTVARSVARDFASQGRLGASLFLSKGRGDLGSAAKIFSTIATQLANAPLAVESRSREDITESFNISQQSLGEQWKSLIFQPLSDLKGALFQSQPYIFVIDGLDECASDEDIRCILRLFAEAKTLETVQLKILVTSRPTHFGSYGIPEVEYQDCIVHNISGPSIQKDISLFLQHNLGIIRRKKDAANNWPGEQNMKLLCQQSEGSFIHASTACRFIRNADCDKNESFFLYLSGHGRSSARNLDQVYTQILALSVIPRNCNMQERQRASGEFRHIVGSIVALFDPLSASALAGLLAVPVETVCQSLRSLRSVLEVPESQEVPISLLHHSFRDFLLDQQRCSDSQFWIDERKSHEALARRSLLLMSNYLKRDLCDLRLPGAPATAPKKTIPLHIRYACRYWIAHLKQSNVELYDNGEVHLFLQKHFLHWLEAISLTGSMSATIANALGSICISKNAPQLFGIVQDAKSFILCNGSVIEKAPLQVYASALVFAPESSLIKQIFSNDAPKWICLAPNNEKWRPQTGKEHTAKITSVAFSYDERQFASASSDFTIRLWSGVTGAQWKTKVGHSNNVNSVVFSPDGRLLASASDDHNVLLWDASTGALQRVLEAHTAGVKSVVFSHDGQWLASGSDDHTILLWDAATGDVQKVFGGHTAGVRSVTFSHDGRQLASASIDNTIRVWNATTGGLQKTFKAYSSEVNSIAFSRDGQWLAAASRGRIVRLWDATTGALQSVYKCDTAGISPVTLHNDGQKPPHSSLASPSDTVKKLL